MSKWIWLGPILAMVLGLILGAALGYLAERQSLQRASRLFNDAADSYTRAKRAVERERALIRRAAAVQAADHA